MRPLLEHHYAYRYDPSGNRAIEQVDASGNPTSHNNLNQFATRSLGLNQWL